ncbi:hypothetical protein HDV04_003553 [Boothiomyces sp. JEL0838]|nr:hypothetical protein HDV04_003553 [Boothiomyces sp. JEL0838]
MAALQRLLLLQAFRKYFVCGRLVCRNCLKSDECPVCNSKSVFVPYHSEKLNQVLTPTNVHLEDLTALLTYQTNQSNDMISYLKKSCLNYCLQSKKNESNYTHSKLLLKQAYEENQKLKLENEELKKELRKRFDDENLYHDSKMNRKAMNDKREPEYVSKHFRM